MNVTTMQRPKLGSAWPVAALFAAGLALSVGPLRAQDSGSYQVVGSIAAYLGTMPAEIVAGHPKNHPEPLMHGGPPASPHAEHIIVALFDEPSGTRIEDAAVTATISGLGHIAATSITLEPMLIAGVVTYGGYISFPGRDPYSIDLQISRPGSPKVTPITFKYQHGSN